MTAKRYGLPYKHFPPVFVRRGRWPRRGRIQIALTFPRDAVMVVGANCGSPELLAAAIVDSANEERLADLRRRLPLLDCREACWLARGWLDDQIHKAAEWHLYQGSPYEKYTLAGQIDRAFRKEGLDTESFDDEGHAYVRLPFTIEIDTLKAFASYWLGDEVSRERVSLRRAMTLAAAVLQEEAEDQLRRFRGIACESIETEDDLIRALSAPGRYIQVEYWTEDETDYIGFAVHQERWRKDWVVGWVDYELGKRWTEAHSENAGPYCGSWHLPDSVRPACPG
jgi:hypothetical protein